MEIRPAHTPGDLAMVRQLMLDYGQYLRANPTGAANICLPDYDREIASLPHPYAVLLLAVSDGHAAGCVALKKIQDGCEMKRLWVGEGFRGLGLGKRLILAAIAWARAAGFPAMLLDTVPSAMPEANALYDRLGFKPVDRYNDNPVPGVVFFRLEL